MIRNINSKTTFQPSHMQKSAFRIEGGTFKNHSCIFFKIGNLRCHFCQCDANHDLLVSFKDDDVARPPRSAADDADRLVILGSCSRKAAEYDSSSRRLDFTGELATSMATTIEAIGVFVLSIVGLFAVVVVTI
jgi:hypothetical protein